MTRGEAINVVVVVLFVCGASLFLEHTLKPGRLTAGRFERLGEGSYWNHQPTVNWKDADLAAWDTATGQICVSQTLNRHSSPAYRS